MSRHAMIAAERARAMRTLADARRADGIRQVDAARTIGVSRQLLRAYENGLRKPSEDTVRRYASALGYDADVTFGYSIMIRRKEK